MAVPRDGSVKVVVTAIIGNAVVTVAKSIGWLVSMSPSMLAEAIHSLADTANQTLIYVGIRAARKGPTREFPWGRGRSRYLWNLVSAMGIFFVGFGVTTYHGVMSLVHAETEAAHTSRVVPRAILAFALFVEGYALLVAWRAVKRAKGDTSLYDYLRHGDDPTAIGVLLEDAIAVVGVILAAGGLALSDALHSPVPDAVASITIGLLLGLMAIILALANGRLLIGTAAPMADEAAIRDFVTALPAVEKVISLKTRILSPRQISLVLEVEFHGGILVDREATARDAQKIRDGEDPAPILVDSAERAIRILGTEINKLESAIRQRFPQAIAIDVEVN